MTDGRWKLDLSKEVADWYAKLNPRDRTHADRAFDRLKQSGVDLREPHRKSLGGGLNELRFSVNGVNTRVTFHRRGDQFRALTVFQKQRQNERGQIDRARTAMAKDKSSLELAEKVEGRSSNQQRGQDRTVDGRQGSGKPQLGRVRRVAGQQELREGNGRSGKGKSGRSKGKSGRSKGK